jgi:hypothetical protein
VQVIITPISLQAVAESAGRIAAEQRVVAFTTGRVSAEVAGCECEGVVALFAEQIIEPARAPVEKIVAGAAVNLVVATEGEDLVIAARGKYLVVTCR